MGLEKRSHLWVWRSCLHRGEGGSISQEPCASQGWYQRGKRPRLFSKTAEFLLPVEEPSPGAQDRQTEGSNAVVWTSLRGGGCIAVSTRQESRYCLLPSVEKGAAWEYHDVPLAGWSSWDARGTAPVPRQQ